MTTFLFILAFSVLYLLGVATTWHFIGGSFDTGVLDFISCFLLCALSWVTVFLAISMCLAVFLLKLIWRIGEAISALLRAFVTTMGNALS